MIVCGTLANELLNLVYNCGNYCNNESDTLYDA